MISVIWVIDIKRIAKIVQEAGRELEDANVELKVPPVPMHDEQWRHKGEVGEHLKAERQRTFRERHLREFQASIRPLAPPYSRLACGQDESSIRRSHGL